MRTVEESDHDLFASEEVLRLDLPEDPVWCDGDALSLVEACKNLVVNAFRYGAPPVVLTVAGDADAARIAIRDQGAGIPEADWPDAAVRFTRQSGVSPTSAGLGLSIVACRRPGPRRASCDSAGRPRETSRRRSSCPLSRRSPA